MIYIVYKSKLIRIKPDHVYYPLTRIICYIESRLGELVTYTI